MLNKAQGQHMGNDKYLRGNDKYFKRVQQPQQLVVVSGASLRVSLAPNKTCC